MQKSKLSVFQALVAAVVILNLFMTGLLAYTLHASRQRKEAEVRTTVENLSLLLDQTVSGTAREIDISLREIQAHLEWGLRYPELQDTPSLASFLKVQKSWITEVSAISICDASGKVWLEYGISPHHPGHSGEPSFIQGHRNQADGGMLVSKLLPGRVGEDWNVVFSRRYNHPDGSFAGIIAASVPASHFAKLLSGLNLGGRGIALMRDLDMALIARHPPINAAAGQTGSVGGSTELTQLVRSGVRSGTFYSDRTADGITRTNAYRRLSGMPVFMVAGLGEEDYLAQWNEDLHKALLLGTLFLLVTGGSAWLLARLIQSREQAAERLRIAATAFDAQVGMFITDADEVIQRVNQAFTKITGYTAEEVLGRTPRMMSSGRHDAAFYAAMWDEIRTTGSWQGEIWDQRKNGEVYPQTLSIGAVKNTQGQVTHYVATLTDITARKSSEEQVRTLAFFDPLTRLPNRRMLMERLEHALRACERHRTRGALLFVDLDHFKSINDTDGHHQGDRLLEQVAARLVEAVGSDNTVARLGGDEFVVLVEDLGEHALEAALQAEALGARILQTLARAYTLGHSEYRGSASIGVTLFGDTPGEGTEEPLKRADLAMSQAKAAGRNVLRFFDPQMQADVKTRAELDAGLRVALEQEQFVLHFQPQVDGDGLITGAEALVRWLHPQQGMISPARFIPVAEESGLILPLGRWVMEHACTLLARWAGDPRTAELTLAVNVSASQFRQDDFVDDVLGILARTGAQPRCLKLELTEGALVAGVEDVIAKMEALKALGVEFSLDDFGTGYSSLAYLKRLPLDQLKIDQSFVRDILEDPSDAEIANMIIMLARSLGIAVIAEGVETEAQRDFLATKGCHHYQGYFFGRPMAAAEFESRLAWTHAAPASPIHTDALPGQGSRQIGADTMSPTITST